MKYSAERKEAVLNQLRAPHNRSVAEVAAEEGISAATIYLWRKQARQRGQLLPEGSAAVPGHAPVRGRDLLRPDRPHHLHTEQGAVGRRPAAEGQEGGLEDGISYALDTPQRQEDEIALGWEDVQHVTEGSVYKTYPDDTRPGGVQQRTIEYRAPFFKPDRERDYRIAWAFFEERS